MTEVSGQQQSEVSTGALRTFLSALGIFSTLPFALCFLAEAQQPNQTARIGILQSGSSSSSASRMAALREGLRELGYVEGKNIHIDYRMQKERRINSKCSLPSWFGSSLMFSLPRVRRE